MPAITDLSLDFSALLNVKSLPATLCIDRQGQLNFANKAFQLLFAQLYGRTFEAGTDLKALTDRLEQINFQHFFKLAFQGLTSKVEHRIVSCEKKVLCLEFNFEPFGGPDEFVEYILLVIVDQTELNVTKEALHNEQERARLLAGASFDGLLIHEYGKVIEANKVLAEMFGYSQEEFQQLSYHKLFIPNDLALVRRKVTNHDTTPCQITAIRKDQSLFTTEIRTRNLVENGHVYGVMSIRNTTEQANSGQERVLYSQEVDLLLENTSDIIARYDRSLRYTYQNAAIIPVTGLPPVDFIGKTFREMGLSEEYTYRWEKTLRQVFDEGKERTIEFDFVSSAGQMKHYFGRIFPEFTKDGTVGSALAISKDITGYSQPYHLLEKRVTRRTQELASLQEISRNIAFMQEMKPLTELILDQLKRLVDYTGALFITIENQTGEIEVQNSRYPYLNDQEKATHISELLRSKLFQEAVHHKRPFIQEDLQGNTRIARRIQNLPGEEVLVEHSFARAFLSIPLVVKDRLIGNLTLVHNQPGYYSARHMQLALTIGNQAAIALENSRLYKQAQTLAVLEERQRLARELHDSTSQVLFSILLWIRTASTLYQRQQYTELAPVLNNILTLSEGGLEEMRAIIFDLRPEILEREGLLMALERQVNALKSRYSLEVTTEFIQDEPAWTPKLKETIYSIIREALHNVVKHARASRVELRLIWNSDEGGAEEILLLICDDGIGFDAQANHDGHIGLVSMRERALKLGGTILIESHPGAGTCLEVRLPRTTFPD